MQPAHIHRTTGPGCRAQKADAGSHAPGAASARAETADAIEAIAKEITEAGDCVSLKDLAVNGDDLIALGFSGREIGEKLNELLELVIEEQLPNEREALLNSLKF